MWGFVEWLGELGETFPVDPQNFGPLLKQWYLFLQRVLTWPLIYLPVIR